MGTWGVGIFQNDVALDVQAAFREVAAEGFGPEEATEKVIEYLDGSFEDPEEGSAAWLSLAMTQWKMGWLVPTVKDRAISIIRAGADLDRWQEDSPSLVSKRRVVLEKALEQLLSPQRAPVRPRRERVALTPFQPGDVVVMTTRQGQEVALWVIENQVHQGVVTASTNSIFQLAALGNPLVPELSEIVAAEPLVITNETEYREIPEFYLHLPQDAHGDSWRVLGNVPFPKQRQRSLGQSLVWVKRTRGRGWWIEDAVESWNDGAGRRSAQYEALQALLDASPSFPDKSKVWTEPLVTKGRDLAIFLVRQAQSGRVDDVDQVLTAGERVLEHGLKRQRIVVADGVLRPLFNLCSHPETGVDFKAIARSGGPATEWVFEMLDAERAQIDEAGIRLPEDMNDRLLRMLPDGDLKLRASFCRIGEGRYFGVGQRATSGESLFFSLLPEDDRGIP